MWRLHFTVVEGKVSQNRLPESLVLVLDRQRLSFLERVIVGLLQNGSAKQDRSRQEFGACEDARLNHQVRAVSTTKDRCFDQREIEAEAAVLLHVVGDPLDAFADSVAYDQEQELTALDVAGHTVHEGLLVHVAVHLGDDLERGPVGTLPYLAL